MTNPASQSTPRPVALIILDGYGHNPDAAHNAVLAAHTPVMDRLQQEHPATLIHTDGRHVGLPDGQMGNSEVGHMNLGAGRVVYQDFTRITKAIEDGDLDLIDALTAPIDAAVAAGRAVHLLGLLSPGGVHSHDDHFIAMAELAARRGAQRIYVHGFLDGRDMPPKSALASLERANGRLAELVGADNGFVASIIGRYYAMDRDNRWDRVEKAYRLLTEGVGEFEAVSAEEGLRAAYERGETDEFVGQLQHAHGAGHPHRETAGGGLHEGHRLALLVEEELAVDGGRRGLAAVIGGHLVTVVVHQKGAAADPAGLGLHQGQHHLHGHRGVDGAAAGPQHLVAGVGGQRVGGGHREALRGPAGLLLCLGGDLGGDGRQVVLKGHFGLGRERQAKHQGGSHRQQQAAAEGNGGQGHGQAPCHDRVSGRLSA